MTTTAGRTVLRVGLTGNIGAGKSTVAEMLATAGCLVIDADRLAHDLLGPGGGAVSAVVEDWGADLLTTEQAIDRNRLAAIVFRDDEALRRLEAILHPLIHDLEERQVAAWDVAEDGIAVTEAALLVETGGAARYDRLVVVSAPRRTRMDRLERRGLERGEARRRMEAQMPDVEKAAAADYRIDNGGPIAETERQVQELLTKLGADLDRKRAAARKSPPAG